MPVQQVVARRARVEAAAVAGQGCLGHHVNDARLATCVHKECYELNPGNAAFDYGYVHVGNSIRTWQSPTRHETGQHLASILALLTCQHHGDPIYSSAGSATGCIVCIAHLHARVGQPPPSFVCLCASYKVATPSTHHKIEAVCSVSSGCARVPACVACGQRLRDSSMRQSKQGGTG